MYLTRDSFGATLRSIAARSSSGSRLIVSYHAPHGGFFGKLILRLMGEPQISSSSPVEMSADLRSVGFVVSEDSGMTDWNERFAAGKAKVHRGYYMRVAVADKL
jgi:hypothetical protein